MGNKIELNIKTKTIVIIGNIGSGKTTVAELLVKLLEDYNSKLIPEPVEQWREIKLLDEFYKDQRKYSLFFQANAFASRLSLYKDIDNSETGILIADSHVVIDRHVFAEKLKEDGHITDLEMTWYDSLFKDWRKLIPEYGNPVYVYLNTPPEVCLERLKKRERKEEVGISLEYLKSIHGKFEDFCDELGEGSVFKYDGKQNEKQLANMIASFIIQNRAISKMKNKKKEKENETENENENEN